MAGLEWTCGRERYSTYNAKRSASNPAQLRSVLDRNTGHEYLPEMRAVLADWFGRYLTARPGE